MIKLAILFLALSLVSCSMVQTHEGAETVQLVFPDKIGNLRHIGVIEPTCEFVSEVIGSDGHWYSNLFVSNSLIVQGAINDLRNRAYTNGGNLVIVYDDFDFASSVTFMGQAYKCSPAATTDKARF
jgi:Domain of unknown function (DUF4156)